VRSSTAASPLCGELEPDVLRADAMRYHGVYGSYGISVFAARSALLDEMAQQVPLVRFARLTLLTVAEVRNAGLRLESVNRISILDADNTECTLVGDTQADVLAGLPAPSHRHRLRQQARQSRGRRQRPGCRRHDRPRRDHHDPALGTARVPGPLPD
jgi:hypothetical protein